MKKLFITSTALLVIVLIFFIAYNVAFRDNALINEKDLNQKGDLEETVEGVSLKEKIVAITDEAVAGFFVDEKNKKISYYSLVNGKTWQTDFDGKNKKNISDTELTGLIDVKWSPEGNKAITVFNKSNNQKNFFLYDFDKKQANKLKEGIDEVSWDQLGNKILYKYFDSQTKARSVDMSNLDGSNYKKLSNVSFRDIVIASIPQSSSVSFWNEGNSEEETQLMLVNANGGETKTIFSGKFGADYLWSPNGKKAWVSFVDNNNLVSGLVDIDGEYADLGIPTLASKITWSSDGKIVYYALPGSIPQEMTMPNDYKNKRFTTNDTFWKTDTTSGKKERIIELEDIAGAYDATNLHLTASEDILFFINRIDGKLYRLQLP
ncbi:MAG: hypothetical protein ACD_11C00116G0020 [uncultured bacterium]|nr:MAG: hypothetical protein ACD_11C00116G0020 [uncultured bacterium]HBR71235.1 hypothetical protein [Candidatus Moranbacteria bacterium]